MWENPESNVTALSSKQKTVSLLLTRSSIHAGNLKASEVSRREQCCVWSRRLYISDISSTFDRFLLLQHITGETPAFPPHDCSNQTQRAGRKSEGSCRIFPKWYVPLKDASKTDRGRARCRLHTPATPQQRVFKPRASWRSSDERNKAVFFMATIISNWQFRGRRLLVGAISGK